MYHQAVPDDSLIACQHCDLLQRLVDLGPASMARCVRCGKELGRGHRDSLDRTLALTIAGSILFVVANSVPMLGLTAVGREASTTVLGGAQQLYRDGEPIVAVLVLLTAIVAPALQIGSMLAIAIGARLEHPPRWVGTLMRHLPATYTWSTIEVMILGVLVALIKIADYATVTPGLALYSLGALVFVLAAMQTTFDPRAVWARVPWADPNSRRVAIGAAGETTD